MAATPRAVRALMGSLAQSRRFDVAERRLCRTSARLFAAGRADEDEVAATIRTALRETGHFVDPHTAVGIAVAEKETARSGACRWSCSSTAHAAKFPDAVEAACGVRPPLPDWLADLDRARRSASPCCRPIRQRSNDLSLRPVAAAREGAAA